MNTDHDLLTAMLQADDRQIPAGVDLDMLADDIADVMEQRGYGLGGITQDDIRAVLPAFLIAAFTNADANAIDGRDVI